MDFVSVHKQRKQTKQNDPATVQAIVDMPLPQRFLTFFYLSTPFGHAQAVQHPLPLVNTCLL